MHGSLLPRYRGRVPVNWAVIRGEKETGATLHVMNEKPDNGAIVDQQAVPILPDDTALEVFHKVTCAAEVVLLNRCLPGLIDGNAYLKPQDLSQGGYFGGRKPEDGKIHWLDSAQNIHNLVRAVAPPYPGAYTKLAGKRMRLLRTLMATSNEQAVAKFHPFVVKMAVVMPTVAMAVYCGYCRSSWMVSTLTPEQFTARFGEAPLPFEDY